MKRRNGSFKNEWIPTSNFSSATLDTGRRGSYHAFKVQRKMSPTQNSIPCQFPQQDKQEFRPAWIRKFITYSFLHGKRFKQNERIRKQWLQFKRIMAREWWLLASVQTPVQIRARQKAATGRSYLGKKTKAERLMLSSATVILKPNKTRHPVSWILSLCPPDPLSPALSLALCLGDQWMTTYTCRLSLVFPFGEVPAKTQRWIRERWEIYSFGSFPATQGLIVTGFLMEPTALSVSLSHSGSSHPVLSAGPSLGPLRLQAIRVYLHV